VRWYGRAFATRISGRYIVERWRGSRCKHAISSRRPSMKALLLRAFTVLLKYCIYIFYVSRVMGASSSEDSCRLSIPPRLHPSFLFSLFVHKGAEILSRARWPISRAGVLLSIVILSIAHTHVYRTWNCIDSTRLLLRNVSRSARLQIEKSCTLKGKKKNLFKCKRKLEIIETYIRM